MTWTQQKLPHYLGRVRAVVEFEGITGGELEQVFRSEAMKRLQKIEDILNNDYLSNREKLNTIRDTLECVREVK